MLYNSECYKQKKGKEMNASEIFSGIFGLIIRCIGLALILMGINHIYRALIMVVQSISITSLTPLLFGIPMLLLGIWFLRGAPQLMSFSYPQN
jgi:hypothetical protein